MIADYMAACQNPVCGGVPVLGWGMRQGYAPYIYIYIYIYEEVPFARRSLFCFLGASGFLIKRKYVDMWGIYIYIYIYMRGGGHIPFGP